MAKKTLSSGTSTKTIEWFERELVARTPTVGILASADQGIWALMQYAGELAGTWRSHRNHMQELDAEAVSASLGAVLAAVVQTANAVGLPLHTLMEQQIALMPMPPRRSVKRHKESHAVIAPPPPLVPPRRTRSVVIPAAAAVPVLPHRRSHAEKPVSVDAHATPLVEHVIASQSGPLRPKRGRPPKQQVATMVSPPAPSLQQPTLLGDEPVSFRAKSKHLARTGAR